MILNQHTGMSSLLLAYELLDCARFRIFFFLALGNDVLSFRFPLKMKGMAGITHIVQRLICGISFEKV